MIKQKTPKPKKCKVCRQLFSPRSRLQNVCSPPCAIEKVNQDKAKKERKETARRKVETRTRREWLKLARQAFNAYIRERDKGQPCICCGRYVIEGRYGGSWDAGHYLSVGAYPELRFTEDNCHKQAKSCNAGSGKYTAKRKTVSQSYRENLIKKIGLERVEQLESHHPPQKWTIDELRGIITEYKSKLKNLTAYKNGLK